MHTQVRKSNNNKDNSKQHGKNRALNQQTRGTHTTDTTGPAKRDVTSLWLHSLRRNTKIPSGKASAKVKKNHGGKASARTNKRWQSIYPTSKAKTEETTEAKHPPGPRSGGKASTRPVRHDHDIQGDGRSKRR